ncbi:MAG: pyridoxamine kinase [Spirochaetales bacterium]|nr:pyridoxamine kinase [Spirochaetales bacterium]MCF7939038.1 pyridoxamine kinase [Spirochaetales bacterium]
MNDRKAHSDKTPGASYSWAGVGKPVPRAAAIHDLSGFGRASLTAIIPILSTMGVQVCPVPTAILSSHTGGFEGYSYVDFTDSLTDYIEHWNQLDLDFDAIYSGFLGSARQIEIVLAFIRRFRRPGQLVVVDPVLGDDGRLYGPITMDLVREMKKLAAEAEVITPNMTEAAFLLEEGYREDLDIDTVKQWARRLSENGPNQVIITSVPGDEGGSTAVVAYNRRDERFWRVDCSYVPAIYPGTGDVFTSVIVGSILQGDSLPLSLDRAVQFVSQGVRATFGYDLPKREGILLERVLQNLRAPIVSASYELLE